MECGLDTLGINTALSSLFAGLKKARKRVMLLDFDQKLDDEVELLQPESSSVRSSVMMEGLPPLRCEVPDGSRLEPLPDCGGQITGCLAWAVKHPIDALCQMAGFGLCAFLGFSSAYTVWMQWQHDCRLGLAARVLFVVIAGGTSWALFFRIQFYKLAKSYKVFDDRGSLKTNFPRLRFNQMFCITQFHKYGGVFVIGALYLLVNSRSTGCTYLCCPPEDVKHSDLLTGGGVAVMVPADEDFKELVALVLVFMVSYICLNLLSRDPVEDDSYMTFVKVRAQRRFAQEGGG